jgi:hypothetical protein
MMVAYLLKVIYVKHRVLPRSQAMAIQSAGLTSLPKRSRGPKMAKPKAENDGQNPEKRLAAAPSLEEQHFLLTQGYRQPLLAQPATRTQRYFVRLSTTYSAYEEPI